MRDADHAAMRAVLFVTKYITPIKKKKKAFVLLSCLWVRVRIFKEMDYCQLEKVQIFSKNGFLPLEACVAVS